jgi:hypothetical protein
MSLLARLSFDDSNYYNVLEAEFEISQPLSRRNLPIGTTQIGLIQLVVESSNNQELYEWGANASLTKNGKLIFISRDYSDTLKTLEFQDAFCVHYKEIYKADGGIPMKTILTISAHILGMHSISLVNNWSGFSTNADNTAATTTSPQHDSDNDSDISSFRP